MKGNEQNFEIIERFSSSKYLSEEDQKLISFAQLALEKSYSPYSNFRVAAALSLSNGEIVTGSNQENAAYPSGMCAERVAAFSAKHSWPKEEILTVALVADSGSLKTAKPISPCGSCRQVLLEYELNQENSMRLILCGGDGEVILVPSAKSLLPLYFDKGHFA